MSILAALAATATLGFYLGRVSVRPTIRALRAEITRLDARVATLDALLRVAEYAAGHDRLTCLPNRTSATKLFTVRALLSWPTIVALIDLDRFKHTNDTYGHHVGDDLLRTIAERLSLAAKERDGAAARLAGDEFAVLLNGGDPDAAKPIAEILDLLAKPATLLTHDGEITVHPTASAGIAVFDGTYGDFDTLLGQADIALYQAKRQRGSHRTYLPHMRMPHNAGRHGPRRHDQHPADRDEQLDGEGTA
ncbi:GGDEF domain-containing protein [Actinoplanes flavus]|uniref:GGDEF domain-containing protein n=1 Tax=Actinoplanes flavus TaxID=2820290 RepID=A0ABS3UD15_9ACTN|nr:GGDEF domain-containing protein [Actinoplanes flavus]MBO3736657.1 GGDEF domain-containing protein [Actinoplanes flavus]